MGLEKELNERILTLKDNLKGILTISKSLDSRDCYTRMASEAVLSFYTSLVRLEELLSLEYFE